MAKKHKIWITENGIAFERNCVFELFEKYYLVTYEHDKKKTTLLDVPFGITNDGTYIFVLGKKSDCKMDDTTLHSVIKAKLAREAMSRVEEISTDKFNFPIKTVIIFGVLIIGVFILWRTGLLMDIWNFIKPNIIPPMPPTGNISGV